VLLVCRAACSCCCAGCCCCCRECCAAAAGDWPSAAAEEEAVCQGGGQAGSVRAQGLLRTRPQEGELLPFMEGARKRAVRMGACCHLPMLLLLPDALAGEGERAAVLCRVHGKLQCERGKEGLGGSRLCLHSREEEEGARPWELGSRGVVGSSEGKWNVLRTRGGRGGHTGKMGRCWRLDVEEKVIH